MKYAEARTKIKTGDALFFSGGKWSSWYGIQVMLVRMFKPSKWSHVGMAWAENGRVFIMESVGTGIRLYPLSKEVEAVGQFGWVSRPEPLPQEALEWAFAQIGTEYPPKWKMVLNKLFKMKVDLEGHMDCSDFFTSILRQAKEILDCEVDPSSISDEVMDEWGPLTLVELS